ncbi:hypothetical protein GH714_012643 [Hevea brasiliensis]|uniref:Exocyst subunit Exo70 family protein n=1 Tax=Hevea brasiliensis TaxID=3981 RepID=A0A6A6MMB7_HEVBR|nr:hypothetical protein GH714_012643 [Hevea brasiliensis]
MGDCGSVIPELEREEDLIAAAKHIARALGSKKNLTDDAKKILADLSTQLSNITTVGESKVETPSEIEGQLNVIQEKIMSWETDQSMIWDSGLDEATQYLNAAEEARRLAERLGTLSLNKDDGEKELLMRAHDILQIAMARLEEEFKCMLVQNRQPFEPEHVSFRSSEEDATDIGSVISLGDGSVEESINRDSISRTSEEFIIDLLEFQDQEMGSDYEDLVSVYLASEKWLTEQIFGGLGTVNLVCFAEASKASMMQLLNFGEAVSIGPHKPEKLFPILDMYEILADLLQDIDSLYSDEAGSCVRTDCREVLRRLGDSARAAFLEFENAIATNVSSNPFAGGGIHHLTRYVMNYINTLTDYHETLNFLLKDHDGEDPISLSPGSSPRTEEENTSGSTFDASPMALHFRSVASILECNLDDKAKLYRDPSLQHIFLMNNIHYMAQKVKNSELRHIFGDDWIRKRNWKFQQHAMNYERATWSSVLSLLKDEGNSNSDSVSKTLLKERFRSFYLAFEEVYRTQTAWLIPDAELRADLQISTSVKVIQAYRTFVGRQTNHISDKHIKYGADDLQIICWISSLDLKDHCTIPTGDNIIIKSDLLL